MELLFYSQLCKLSVEYLQYNTITNIEYKRKFEQDNIYISIVLDVNRNDLFYIKYYYGIANNYNIDYENSLEQKCLSSHGIMSYMNDDDDLIINYEEVAKLGNDKIVAFQFICLNITLDQIMDKIFFYYNYES